MANEATLIFETTVPIPFTVANATAITKGTTLKITDPLTAIASSAALDSCAGIAQADKIASDGVTKLAVYRGGIFKVFLSGSCNVGDSAVTGVEANYFKSGANLSGGVLSGGVVWGAFLETGTTGESVLMELRPTYYGRSAT